LSKPPKSPMQRRKNAPGKSPVIPPRDKSERRETSARK